jgi:tRNA G18 (ribose-2'-O)-methylase SpoU
MGAIFRLPSVEHVPLLDALARLRAAGVACVAAHPSAGGTALPDVDLRRDVCVVLGSEGHGISPAVLAACDTTARIPMALDVDSLNVASAAAAFFYEAFRQRRGGGVR